MDLKTLGWERVDWVHLALGRDHWRDFVKAVMIVRFP
jgi:hypothetical protein